MGGFSQKPWCLDSCGEPVLAGDEDVVSFCVLGAFEADGRGLGYQESLQLLAQVCPWWLPRACLRRPEDAHLVEEAISVWGDLTEKDVVLVAVNRALGRAIALERKGTT
jgi:hypothetical protein